MKSSSPHELFVAYCAAGKEIIKILESMIT